MQADRAINDAGDLLEGPFPGRKALRKLGDRVDVAADRNDLSTARLRTLLRADDSLWLDSTGRALYIDPVHSDEHSDEHGDEHGDEHAAAGASTGRSAPLAQTFELHSNPGANLTIYLDVDGHTVSGTGWNAEFGVTSGAHPAWDPAGDGPVFTDSEKLRVQQVWAMVAEDFAPFDVDVTTEDPGAEALVRSSGADPTYGTRVLISPSDNAHARICNRGCGGVAYIDVFDVTGSYYQPAWVFPQALNTTKSVAEAATHEAGHNLALDHDGTAFADYYAGHGIWAPIMGVGYDRPLAQWSQGSYPGANNSQDDVAILRGLLGSRADEASGSAGDPAPLPEGPAVIASRDDVDAYLLGSCQGGSAVEVAPVEVAPNLDVRATLVDSSGVEQAVSAPGSGAGDGTTASGLGAVLSIPEGGGDGWVLTVDGAGQGAWSSSGYDDYGSLGAYTVSAVGCDGALLVGAPSEPTGVLVDSIGTDSLTLTWSEPASAGDGPVSSYVVGRSGTAETVTLGSEARRHTFTGLAPGTTYELSVRAVNGTGAGRSAVVSATTDTPPPRAPSAPRDLVGGYDHARGVLQTFWTEPEDTGTQPIDGYGIYLDGEYLGMLESTSRGVDISGGFAEGDYLVGISAVSAAGASPIATTTVTVVHPEPPANDDAENAEVLTGRSGVVAGDNTNATSQDLDPPAPSSFGAGGLSVWYSWTAPRTGTVNMRTQGGGSDRDTTLAAYTGEPGATTQVAGDDDTYGWHAAISFDATEGVHYLLVVDGFAGAANGRGPFELSWSQPLFSAAPVVEVSVSPSRVDLADGEQAVTVTARITDDDGVPVGDFVTAQVLDPTDLVATEEVRLDFVEGGPLDQTYRGTYVVLSSSSPGERSVYVRGVRDSEGMPQTDEGADPTPNLSVVRSGEPPVAPTQVRALPRVNAASVSWEHGFVGPDDGSRVYTVTAAPGGATCSSSSVRSCRVEGLTNGRAYTFTVVASDTWGASEPSEPSDAVTPRVDSAAPVVEFGDLSTDRVSSAGGSVDFEVRVTDDLSGLDMSGFFLASVLRSSDFERAGGGSMALVEGGDLDSSFEGSVTIDAGAAPGEHQLVLFPLEDLSGNGTGFIYGPRIWIGTAAAPQVPVISDVEGRVLDVSWPEPADDGGNLITSYELMTDVGEGLSIVDAEESTTDGVVRADVGPLAVAADEPVRVRVRAFNAGGPSAWSEWSESVLVPAVVPSAPRDVSAVAGDGEATVSWSAPVDDGGSPVTGYEVTASPGGASVSVGAGGREVVVPGLSNGAAYSFTVVALNEVGRSEASAPSEPVTPQREVSPPVVEVSVSPSQVDLAEGEQSVTVTARITDDDGVPVGDFVRAQVFDPVSLETESVRLDFVEGGPLDQTYRGTYVVLSSSSPGERSVYVRGVRDSEGTPQADEEVTALPNLSVVGTPPPPPVPVAPTQVRALPRVNAASVSWEHGFVGPDDGSRVYTVTAAPGGATCSSSSVRSCRVEGLTNGRAYTFTVVASDSAGASDPSAPSDAVTPRTDTAAPVVEFGDLSTDRVSSAGGSVDFEVRVTDDLSGLREEFVYMVTVLRTTDSEQAGGGQLLVADGGDLDTSFAGSVIIDAGAAPGEYRVVLFPLEDLSGNTTGFVYGPTIMVGTAAAPEAPRATPREGRRVAVSWPEPVDDGGNLITSYEVETDVDDRVTVVDAPESTSGGTVSTLVGPFTVPADEGVRIRVRAVNAGGPSAWSEWSESVLVPAVAPSAPRSVSAVAGDGQATVSWSVPLDDGGSPVTGYEVTASPGGASVSVGAGGRDVVVPGLSNGTAYSFTVVALNEAGRSEASTPSEPVTPQRDVTVPSAPQSVSAVAGDGQATVSWAAPASDGGSPVTEYRVTAIPGGLTSTFSGDTLSGVVDGLENGSTYAFTVVAINEAGPSVASVRSTPVIPFSAPAKPGRPKVKVKRGKVVVSWKAPSENGRPIEGYVLSVQKGRKTKTVDTGRTRAVLKKLKPGKYKIRVLATNEAGRSAWSGPAKVKVRR